jgi:hypothetical protein
MFRCFLPAILAAVPLLPITPASADSMRCTSVNGNVNCAGSDAMSCQTVNGRRVCISGHGDVVQSFGPGSTYSDPGDDEGLDDGPPAAMPKRLPGRSLFLQRDGAHLHLRTDRLSIDRY